MSRTTANHYPSDKKNHSNEPIANHESNMKPINSDLTNTRLKINGCDVKNIQENGSSGGDAKLTNTNEEDELSPLPEDLNSSIGNSPKMSPCMSPVLYHRQRSHTIDNAFHNKHYLRTKSTPVGTPQIIPKDPIQPKSGSIGDIHNGHEGLDNKVKVDVEEDEEEMDEFFSELPPMRSRSHTCPDSALNAKRKLKAKSLRRPSTPPPFDLCTALNNMKIPSNVEKEIDNLVKVNDR